jgi:receptor expression-enhancing protein 5/6
MKEETEESNPEYYPSILKREFSPINPEEEKDKNNENNENNDSKIKIKISITEKWKEIMLTLKQKTGIDGIYIIIFLLLCVLLVYLGIFGTLITNMVGTLYPGFSTIKSIEKNKRKKEWLTYWVVYGCFIIFDMFSSIIMKIIPFYFVLKILFLIWMFLPGSNGCKLVYNSVIFKLFKSIENIVDFFFEETKDLSKQIIKETKNKGFEKMKQLSKGLKTFKGFGLGKKGDMSEAMKAVQELEKEKNENNQLYGKEFYSTLILPTNNEKKDEKSNNFEKVEPIKEEQDNKKENNRYNNVEQDDRDDDISTKLDEEHKRINDNIKGNKDNNVDKEKIPNDGDDNAIEFSDIVKDGNSNDNTLENKDNNE